MTEAVMQRNLEFVAKAGRVATLRMVAFGAMPDTITDMMAFNLADMLRAFRRDQPVHCLGLTKSGMPKHPLARGQHRVPDGAQPQPWTTFD